MTATVSSIVSIDPTTDELLAEYPLSSGTEIDAALSRTKQAQELWRQRPPSERAVAIRAVAEELTKRRDEGAAIVTAEMGKTTREALAEIDKSVWACEYYAEHAEEQLAPQPISTEWQATYVQFEPLGVVLAVMPWNYPVWQVFRAGIPALMAGNTLVLKHSSNVTGSALFVGSVFAAAVPDLAILEVLVLPGRGVAALIGDERIAAVTLTGSESVGVQVAGVCAKHLKKSVLELGGSDPFVVLADADPDATAAAAVGARFLNAGQSCIASKRFIVIESIAEPFEEAFAMQAAELRMGDPRSDVDIGPMSRRELRDELADQVARGVDGGARVLTGGEVPDRAGAFYPPTVVAGVTTDNVLAREETFGPAAAVIRVRDEAEAIAAANASRYGLSASIWTGDVEHAKALAGRLQVGSVFINLPSASDPRVPIGGTKRSGWGRELGAWGIREFVNVQSVTAGPRAT
jgi:succinate-semialdehyde dehydrogenase/glutarate-semialdehyde dehydrogenase